MNKLKYIFCTLLIGASGLKTLAQLQPLKENRARNYTNNCKMLLKRYYNYLQAIADTSKTPEDRQQKIFDVVNIYFDNKEGNDVVVNDLFKEGQPEYPVKDYLANLMSFYAGKRISIELSKKDSINVSDILMDPDGYYLIILTATRYFTIYDSESNEKNKKILNFYLKIIPDKTYKFIGTKFHDSNPVNYQKAKILYGQNDNKIEDLYLGGMTKEELIEETRKKEAAKTEKENKEKAKNLDKNNAGKWIDVLSPPASKKK